MHRYILHNEEVRGAGELVLSPGQVGLLSGWGVFSTLRVVEGVLFAWERHWARMKRDAAHMRVPFPADSEKLRSLLLELVAANQVEEATLRVAVVRNRGGMWEGPGIARDWDLIAFTTDIKKWGSAAKLALQPQGRHSAGPFSGTKILSWAANLTWAEEAQSRGFDEVILLNERGEVSECTSANIFAGSGDRVFTPPLSSGCLPGVTRQLLLEEVRVPGVEIVEKTLLPVDLEAADEVFITSTTRDLLPVVSVEGLKIREGDHRLRTALDKALHEYVRAYVAREKAARLHPAASQAGGRESE